MATLARKPLHLYLRPEQLDALRALAQRRGVSVTELVRQGVDRVLAEASGEEDPFWKIVGIGDSGLGDLAAEHDRYLDEFDQEDRHRWQAKSS